MSDSVEVRYDSLVAAEKLKSGTKYERLAAIAFQILTQRSTVHDMRLRGETGVPHQIDAVVGQGQKRILIEAKHYERPVDLPVVRNFWAVVEDLQPEEAFVVTTAGFSANAVAYAAAKGISLAVLRPPTDDDWEGLIRRISLQITATEQTAPAEVTWELHSDDHDRIDGDVYSGGLQETRALGLAGPDGVVRPFYPLLWEQLSSDYAEVPLGGEEAIGRLNRLSEPTWLYAPGLDPLRVTAWKWSASVTSSTETTIIDRAVGRFAAELMLRTLDDSTRHTFTREQIQSWAFDGHSVVPRGG